MAGRKHLSAMPLLIAAAFLLALAACWIIPLRLGLGPNGNFYTFGYIGDEYTYAFRMQPLVEGATTNNPLNGIGDARVISPFFQENLTRGILTLFGIHIGTFFWAWRFLSPLAIAALVIWLAWECLPRRGRPWSAPLVGAVGIAGFALLYALYDLLVAYPPLQGWLNRVPTNSEFMLSLLIAIGYVRFLKIPTAGRAVALAIISAITVYLRFYTTLPWAPVIVVSLPWLVWRREVRIKEALLALAVVVAAVIPLALVVRYNSQFPAYHEMIARHWPHKDWQVHPQWPIYAGCALALSAAAWPARRPWRELLIGCAVSLAIWIFASAAMGSVADQITTYDRYPCFYLVALVMAALLAVGQSSVHWRGRLGAGLARRCALGAVALALAAALATGWRNATYDFAGYPWGPYASIVHDLRYVPAYEWVAQETPPGALFLIDNGINWPGIFSDTDEVRRRERLERAAYHMVIADDLFQIVARRRRVWHLRVRLFAIEDEELQALVNLQTGTFGGGTPVPLEKYVAAVERFKPEYVLWRKSAPVPRAHGEALRTLAEAEVVYADSVCEIWKLRYPEGQPVLALPK